MEPAQQSISKLLEIKKGFDTKSGDLVIGDMIVEFAVLIGSVSNELEKSQKATNRLTVVTAVLTFVAAVIGGGQLYFAAFPPNQTPLSINGDANKGSVTTGKEVDKTRSQPNGTALTPVR